MKPISNDFKTAITQFGREYSNKINIYDYLIMATESNNEIITEDGNDLIAKPSYVDVEKELTDEDIFSIKLITKGEIISTMMKELEFISTEDIEIGRLISFKTGLKIDTSNYEYIDYGKFIVYKKEIDEASGNYVYTCYDFMLKAMRTIGQELNFGGSSTVTGQQLLEKICDILSIDFDNSVEDENHKPTPFGMIGNKSYNINTNIIKQNKLTYRDLLNLLCQFFGVSIIVNDNNLEIKLLGEIKYNNDTSEWYIDNDTPTSVATITGSYLNDENVTFKKKYGKINALEITGIDVSKQKYVQNVESVNNDGTTLYSIKNNILINDNSVWDNYGDEIANNIFKMIDQTNFELYDLATKGILFLDWLDYFTIQIKGVNHKCLLLNSEITIKSGIGENIYIDEPTQNVSEYTSTQTSTNDIIYDTIRARGNIYATNFEASGSINATKVGKDLENVIKGIAPSGGGVDIPIQDTPPQNPQTNDLWIDTSDNDTLKYYDGTNWVGVSENVTGDTLPIGSMVPYGSTTAPTNWLVCDGSAVSRTTYAELFAVIGTSYGAGDGSTTFNLPNKKGRSSVGYNSNDTDFNAIGKKGGSKELQEHRHRIFGSYGTGSSTVDALRFQTGQAGGEYYDYGYGYNIFVENTGTGNSGNLSPYETDCWIIKAKQSAGVIANVSNTYSTSQTDTYSCDYINDCNSYSSTETFTGKYWVDGKPIYRKTVNCGTLPNTDTKTVAHSITSFNRIINIYGYAYASSSQNSVPLPFTSPTNIFNIAVMAGTTIITIVTGADQSAFNESYITLEYTKNN